MVVLWRDVPIDRRHPDPGTTWRGCEAAVQGRTVAPDVWPLRRCSVPALKGSGLCRRHQRMATEARGGEGGLVTEQDRWRFTQIRRRLARATPGPWTVARRHRTLVVAMVGTPEEILVADTHECGVTAEQDARNAAFLAHSRADITWLTERVRDLERQKGRGS
jgi:hypothetical protein